MIPPNAPGVTPPVQVFHYEDDRLLLTINYGCTVDDNTALFISGYGSDHFRPSLTTTVNGTEVVTARIDDTGRVVIANYAVLNLDVFDPGYSNSPPSHLGGNRFGYTWVSQEQWGLTTFTLNSNLTITNVVNQTIKVLPFFPASSETFNTISTPPVPPVYEKGRIVCMANSADGSPGGTYKSWLYIVGGADPVIAFEGVNAAPVWVTDLAPVTNGFLMTHLLGLREAQRSGSSYTYGTYYDHGANSTDPYDGSSTLLSTTYKNTPPIIISSSGAHAVDALFTYGPVSEPGAVPGEFRSVRDHGNISGVLSGPRQFSLDRNMIFYVYAGSGSDNT